MNTKVPAAELVQWSKGNVDVEQDKNYVTILGGFTVSCATSFDSAQQLIIFFSMPLVVEAL
jgi:hypothetical protein